MQIGCIVGSFLCIVIENKAIIIMEAQSYQYLLSQPEWQSKRKAILTRDGNRCRNCGSIEHLEVHHRQYHVNKADNQKIAPWNYDDQYLITLCDTCHRLGHEKYQIPVFIINY